MIPASKDLRAANERTNYQRVGNQGNTNSCGGYGRGKTRVECMRELAGLPFRAVSAQWIYNRACEIEGALGSDVGSGAPALDTVARIGWIYEDQFDPTVRPSAQDVLARENMGGAAIVASDVLCPNNDLILGIKRSIAMGIPVSCVIPVGESLWAGINGNDWRKHDPQPGDVRNTHHIGIVGFDDTVERLLFEDSSGAGSWDGGFFGVTYAVARTAGYITHMGKLDYVPGVSKPIPDFNEEAAPFLNKILVGRWFDKYRNFLAPDVAASYLNGAPIAFWSTALEAFARTAPLLQTAGVAALQEGGVHGLLAWCKRNGITDLMLEVLAAWPRGQVRRYFDTEKLDYTLIDWSPL